MTDRTGHWRATYTSGDWIVLGGPTSLVIMTPAKASASEIVNRLWDAVVGADDLEALVEALARFGVDRMPDFGAFFWVDGEMRSLVRGSVRAVDIATGDVIATGEGIRTWREDGHGEVRRVRVDMQEVDQDTLLQLPLVVGAVAASAVVIDATDDAIVSSPQSPVAARAAGRADEHSPEEAQSRLAGINAAPEASRTAEPADQRLAITGVPVTESGPGGLGSLGGAVLGLTGPPTLPAPTPSAPGPNVPSASGVGGQRPFGQPAFGGQGQDQPYPPGFAQGGQNAGQGGQGQAGQGQAGPGYGPGFAASSGSFAPRQPQDQNPPLDRPDAPSPWAPGQQGPGQLGRPSSQPSAQGRDDGESLVLAVMCTMGHPNPQEAQRCRRCGNPVQGQAQLVQRPVMATLRPSTGQPVNVDRSVLIGRSPTATRVGSELPHLVTVPSPSHDISRTHLQISPEGWELMATDLHSTNGTALLRPGAHEPERLTPGEPVPVFPGCVLDLGDGVTIRVDHPA